MANLHQWALYWKMYCDDNNGYWLSGDGGGSGVWWTQPMLSMFKIDEKLRLLPAGDQTDSAAKTRIRGLATGPIRRGRRAPGPSTLGRQLCSERLDV